MPTDPHPTPTGRRLLRCDQCRQTTEVTHADLMRFTREGWPKCCRQTMAYFIEAPAPTEAGTRLAHRCPVCGHEWVIAFPPGVDMVAGGPPECERCRGKVPAAGPE